jgi:hypothetical protein
MVASSLGHSAGMLMTYRKLEPDKRVEIFNNDDEKE